MTDAPGTRPLRRRPRATSAGWRRPATRRSLPHPAESRRRRHGRRLRGGAGGARPPDGRAQGDQVGHGHAGGHRPLRVRAPGAGADEPPEHRRRLRRRGDAGGPALLRDGVRPGDSDHRVLRQAPAHASASGSTLFIDVCEGVQHAHQKGDHPPRHQAVERAGDDPGRRSTAPKIIDFGVAKATSQRLTERTVFTELGQLDRHAGVHEPRAGRDDEPRHRHPHGRLLARRAALRAARGRAALRLEGAAAGGPRRDPADAPRGRAAAAQQPRRAASAAASDDVGDQPARGPARSLDAGARGRPRLDHDEGAREGSGAALRHRPRAGARHRTASQRRAGAGRAAERALSREEAVPPPSGPVPRGGAVVLALVAGVDRHVVGAAAGDACRAAGRRRARWRPVARRPSPRRSTRFSTTICSPPRRPSAARGQGKDVTMREVLDVGGRAHRRGLEGAEDDSRPSRSSKRRFAATLGRHVPRARRVCRRGAAACVARSSCAAARSATSTRRPCAR